MTDRSRGLTAAGRPIAGYLFFSVAVLVVPLATLLAIASTNGLEATMAAETARVVRSSLEPLIGPALEERGLGLVEGHRDILLSAADEFDVPAEWLGAVMFAESRGRSGLKSSAGALGLMQLVESSARDAARRAGIELPLESKALEEALLGEAALNVRLGAAHLAWLMKHRGDWSDEAVMVSYNAGRARLFQWIARRGSYEGFVAAEEERASRGERTTGSLAYARQVLRAREILSERGRLGPAVDPAKGLAADPASTPYRHPPPK